jgi:hypothetical protein
MIDDAIPAWTDGYGPAESGQLHAVASELAQVPTGQLQASLDQYAQVFAGSETEVEAMSKVYLLLRALYNLPENIDRNQVKVFGGWIHPSIDNPSTGFNLSWPVSANNFDPSAPIQVTGIFGGYFGKAYDAPGELNYFDSNFPRRVF